MNHEVTLSGHDVNFESAIAVKAECSCGEILLDRGSPVLYSDLATAVYHHTRPEIEGMMKEVLKDVSLGDIMKGILKMRKP